MTVGFFEIISYNNYMMLYNNYYIKNTRNYKNFHVTYTYTYTYDVPNTNISFTYIDPDKEEIKNQKLKNKCRDKYVINLSKKINKQQLKINKKQVKINNRRNYYCKK